MERPRQIIASLVLGILMAASCALGATGEAQLSRFEGHLSPIEKILFAAKNPEEIADDMVASNSRVFVFETEGLLKLYIKAYPELEKYQERFKELEEKLGAYADSKAWIQTAESIKAPEEVIGYLKKRHQQMREAFASYLKNDGWLDSDKGILPKVRKRLKKTNWMPYAKDREYVIGRLQDHLKKLQKNDYDMSDLSGDEGLHKFRRQVRRFLIYVESLNGMVLLDDKSPCPLRQFLREMTGPYAESKFGEILPSKLEIKPCYLPKCLYTALVETSERLGDLKDMGEAEQLWLPRALRATNLAKDDAEARAMAHELAEHLPSYTNITEAAKPYYNEIKRTPLLGSLRDAVANGFVGERCAELRTL